MDLITVRITGQKGTIYQAGGSVEALWTPVDFCRYLDTGIQVRLGWPPLFFYTELLLQTPHFLTSDPHLALTQEGINSMLVYSHIGNTLPLFERVVHISMTKPTSLVYNCRVMEPASSEPTTIPKASKACNFLCRVMDDHEPASSNQPLLQSHTQKSY